MYPAPPYPGFGWPLNHHIAKATRRELYYMLLAVAAHADSPDPAFHINQMFAANGILTTNVRNDTGQADTWRDYQQILSELGLIYSTRVQPQITPTPLGLAYLDGALSYSELMTMQALRLQYPNGQSLNISADLSSCLSHTRFDGRAGMQLDKLQSDAGVLIRPAVLIWQILCLLGQSSEEMCLTGKRDRQLSSALQNTSGHATLRHCNNCCEERKSGAALPVRESPRGAPQYPRMAAAFVLDPTFSVGPAQPLAFGFWRSKRKRSERDMWRSCTGRQLLDSLDFRPRRPQVLVLLVWLY